MTLDSQLVSIQNLSYEEVIALVKQTYNVYRIDVETTLLYALCLLGI